MYNMWSKLRIESVWLYREFWILSIANLRIKSVWLYREFWMVSIANLEFFPPDQNCDWTITFNYTYVHAMTLAAKKRANARQASHLIYFP